MFLEDFEERFHLVGTLCCVRGEITFRNIFWSDIQKHFWLMSLFRAINGHTKRGGGYSYTTHFSQIKSMMFCISINKPVNSKLSYFTRGRFRGRHTWCTPSIFYRDKVPDFVWVPQAQRMHQIVQIDFKNCNFSLLLRGHIHLRHPLSSQVPKFCKPLMWVPPLLKNPGSAPVYCNIAPKRKSALNLWKHVNHQKLVTAHLYIMFISWH